MVIIDANVILRYLLNDVEDLAIKSKHIIEKIHVFIPNEIVAEVVYVLQKFYEVPRNEILLRLIELVKFENIDLPNKAIIIKAFDKELLKCIDKE